MADIFGTNFYNTPIEWDWARFQRAVDPQYLYKKAGEIAGQLENKANEFLNKTRNQSVRGQYTIPKGQIKDSAQGPRTVKQSDILKEELDKLYKGGRSIPNELKRVAQATAKQLPSTEVAPAWRVLANNVKAGKAGLIGAGLAGLAGALETGYNWNKPGSDALTRAGDIVGTIGDMAGTGLGTFAGALAGHPLIGGGLGGGLMGLNHSLINEANKTRRTANLPYEQVRNQVEDETFKNMRDKYLSQYGNRPSAKQIADADAYIKRIKDAYYIAKEGGRPYLNQPFQEEPIQEIDTMSPEDWYNNILKEGKDISSLPPITPLMADEQNGTVQPVQSSTAKGNIPQSINYPNNNLMGLNGAPTGYGYNAIPTSIDILAEMMGYGRQPIQQQLIDNRDEAEDKPPLRPKANIDNEGIQATGGNNNLQTADNVALERLGQLYGLLGKGRDKSSDWDAIRRANYASSIGLTPYQIWGDYPNQDARATQLASLINSEYKIRKDIEDRQRMQQIGEALSQKFADPSLSGLLLDKDNQKTFLEKIYAPYATEPLDARKQQQKNQATWFNTALMGQNTLANTALGRNLIDINKLYGLQNARDIANFNQLNQNYRTNLNNQVRLKLQEMKGNATQQDLTDLVNLVNSGVLDEDNQAVALDYIYREFGLGENENGIGSLFK